MNLGKDSCLGFSYLLLLVLCNALRVFKKIADALSFFPVSRTLNVWNAMYQGRYPGRGAILSQVVLVAEHYAFFANSCDVLSKTLFILGNIGDSAVNSPFWSGMYTNNLFAVYTRILCHSILLNTLDEMYETPLHHASEPFANRSTSSNGRCDAPTIETVDEEVDTTVVIVSKLH